MTVGGAGGTGAKLPPYKRLKIAGVKATAVANTGSPVPCHTISSSEDNDGDDNDDAMSGIAPLENSSPPSNGDKRKSKSPAPSPTANDNNKSAGAKETETAADADPGTTGTPNQEHSTTTTTTTTTMSNGEDKGSDDKDKSDDNDNSRSSSSGGNQIDTTTSLVKPPAQSTSKGKGKGVGKKSTTMLDFESSPFENPEVTHHKVKGQLGFAIVPVHFYCVVIYQFCKGTWNEVAIPMELFFQQAWYDLLKATHDFINKSNRAEEPRLEPLTLDVGDDGSYCLEVARQNGTIILSNAYQMHLKGPRMRQGSSAKAYHEGLPRCPATQRNMFARLTLQGAMLLQHHANLLTMTIQYPDINELAPWLDLLEKIELSYNDAKGDVKKRRDISKCLVKLRYEDMLLDWPEFAMSLPRFTESEYEDLVVAMPKWLYAHVRQIMVRA